MCVNSGERVVQEIDISVGVDSAGESDTMLLTYEEPTQEVITGNAQEKEREIGSPPLKLIPLSPISV